MAKSTCESCGRIEGSEDGQCGTSVDCCDDPHAACLNCDGTPLAGISRTEDAAARLASNVRLCVTCNHPSAAHSYDGPCWVTQDAKGAMKAIPHWTPLPAGWKRCKCRECVTDDEEDLDINRGAA